MIIKKEKLELDLLDESEMSINDIRELSNKIMKNIDTTKLELEIGENVDNNVVKMDYDFFITLLKFIQLLHARIDYREKLGPMGI